MSTLFSIRTLIEFASLILFIFALINEDKFIDFEMELRRIILGNIRHAMRTHKQKKLVKENKHLHLQVQNDKIAINDRYEEFVA